MNKIDLVKDKSNYLHEQNQNGSMVMSHC